MRAHRLTLFISIVVLTMQGGVLFMQIRTTGQSRLPVNQFKAVRDAQPGMIIDISDAPVKGNTDTAVVLIEFSDYECPYCARHATEVLPYIESELIATGKVRYAFLNNPLPMHANARLFAAAAVCAGEQDRYWEMHDAFFKTKPADRAGVMDMLLPLQIDAKKLSDCVEGNAAAKKIDKDVEIAQRLGLTGTPAFAVGVIEDSNKVTVRKFVQGAQPMEVFQSAIIDATKGE